MHSVSEHTGSAILESFTLADGEEVQLWPAVRSDLDAIIGLLTDDAIGATRDGVQTAHDRRVYATAFERVNADRNQLLVVATADAHVVGTFQLTLIPGLARRGATRAQIEAVRVHHDYRSRGLGAHMLEWAIAESRRRGCDLVQLTTDKARQDAHRFYAKLGFEASHEGYKLVF